MRNGTQKQKEGKIKVKDGISFQISSDEQRQIEIDFNLQSYLDVVSDKGEFWDEDDLESEISDDVEQIVLEKLNTLLETGKIDTGGLQEATIDGVDCDSLAYECYEKAKAFLKKHGKLK